MTYKIRFPAYPYIVWTAIFILAPLFLVAWFALTSSDGSLTIVNIANVAQFGAVFMRSVLLGVIATVICLIMAYPIAFVMSRADYSYR